MREKLINYVILLLLCLMIVFRIISRDIFKIYNDVLYGVSILILIFSSLYFSFKLKFLQFNVFKMLDTVKKSSKDDVKALFMSMGAKIGVGSIAGIGLAIYVSGPGVLLWVWIISLLSSILTYCESYLGSKYKIDNKGGVFYYICKGLKNKSLSIIYTLILIFVYAVGFIGIQSNTIVKSVGYVSSINSYVIILLIMIGIGIIVFNEVGSIINFMAKIVPVMCLLYLLFGIVIIVKMDSVWDIFLTVIRDGFKFDSVLWGIIIVGLKRGMFATEAGIGTSSIASCISNNSSTNQGIFQVMGVHFISLIVVTITGFIIIGSEYSYVGNINGIEIVMDIFNNYFGTIGSVGLCFIIILFAISTIVSGYYYSIKGMEFLKVKLVNSDYFIFKLFIILLILLGGIVDSTVIWSLVDSLILFLLIINIYTIWRLRKEIV